MQKRVQAYLHIESSRDDYYRAVFLSGLTAQEQGAIPVPGMDFPVYSSIPLGGIPNTNQYGTGDVIKLPLRQWATLCCLLLEADRSWHIDSPDPDFVDWEIFDTLSQEKPVKLPLNPEYSSASNRLFDLEMSRKPKTSALVKEVQALQAKIKQMEFSYSADHKAWVSKVIEITRPR